MTIRPKPPSGAAPAAPPLRWSITRRLTQHYVVTTIALLLLVTGSLYVGLQRSLDDQDRTLLRSKVRVLRVLLSDADRGEQALASEIEHEAGEEGSLHYFLRVVSADNETLLETPGMSEVLAPTLFPTPHATQELLSPGEIKAGNRRYLLASARARTGGSSPKARVLHAALDVSHNDALLAKYRAELLIAFIAGTTFAAIMGALLTRRGLKPLETITQATQRVTASHLDERLAATRWPRELTALAAEFDGMLNRLQDSFHRLSQFSGDMAHALRNPINNLRGEAEVALSRARSVDEYQQTLASSLEELDRLSRMIDGLLFIAQADDVNKAIERRDIALRTEMEAVRDFYEALAAEKGIHVICEGEAQVTGDAMLVRRAISNLLANALKHTPSGGTITLSAGESPMGAEIRVIDTGQGIPSEHLPHVFQRFYQVDKTRDDPRKGVGLGLAIVKSILQLHRGSAEIESTVGKGTCVTLRFPKRAAEGSAPSTS